MKKNLALKRLLWLLAGLVILFAIVNLLWLFFVKLPYDRRAERLERIEERDGEDVYVRYEKTSEGYNYIIKIPEYMNFEGRMIVNEVLDSQEEEPNVSLTIYTQFLHADEYMIDIFALENEYSAYSVSFMVDEAGMYLPYENMEPADDELYREIAERYQDRIKKLLERGKEMFE